MKLLTITPSAGRQPTACLGKLVGYFLGWWILALGIPAYSKDATWLAHPVDNNWNNPANWSTGVVPIIFDSASFDGSDITDIEIPAGTSIFNIVFDSTADAFTITALPGVGFQFNGSLLNDSGVEQNFIAATNASNYGSFTFVDGSLLEETITGPVTFTEQPRNSGSGFPGSVTFNMTRAGDATFHNLGANVAGGMGGRTDFWYAGASAEECTIINEGGTVADARGAATQFILNTPTADRATLIANAGTNGGGGSFTFYNQSKGGTARVELFGNGYLDISPRDQGTLTVGSLEGDGVVYLGRNTLSVGGNSVSTAFAGLLKPGDPSGGPGTGSLIKTSSTTLTLSGANLYTAGTTVTGGTLVVTNTTGSATGTGAVFVNAGTLGGSGIISGAVTVGTGSGTGAFLAPAHRGNKQLTLTIQGSLTFNSDSTYTYTFKAKSSKSKIDKVVANGITIISGGSFNLSGTAQGTLTQGTVLPVISNTSATPISGTFSNLPDGAIVTVNGNNLQADYQGGDGNDLTLTVVP